LVGNPVVGCAEYLYLKRLQSIPRLRAKNPFSLVVVNNNLLFLYLQNRNFAFFFDLIWHSLAIDAMLCAVCDNITLKSLNRHHGYKHLASFHALQASADGGLCSLCTILWKAVDTRRTQEAKDRQEDGEEEEKYDVLFMDFPVRLTVDGMIQENKEKAIEKLKQSDGKLDVGATHELYDLHTAKAPAVLFACSLQPDHHNSGGLGLRERGSVSLYREPRKSK
jgi:hypothetical protein